MMIFLFFFQKANTGQRLDFIGFLSFVLSTKLFQIDYKQEQNIVAHQLIDHS